MPTRLVLVAVASLALGVGQYAGASPITYAYSGTLDQPLNGSRQFGGTFTINGDPKVSYDGSVQEGGNDVTVTLKMGGQSFTFANPSTLNGTNFGPDALFSVGLSPTWTHAPSGPTQDETVILGSSSGGLPNAEVGLTFYGPSVNDHSNLRDLSFQLGVESAYLMYSSGGPGYVGHGTIDSVVLVPAPEPSTLAIFTAIGAVAIAFQRHARACRSRPIA